MDNRQGGFLVGFISAALCRRLQLERSFYAFRWNGLENVHSSLISGKIISESETLVRRLKKGDMSKLPEPKYGGRGRPWHDNFKKYMLEIANHPNYAGMPDAFTEPGRVQWEAPSNRGSGKFKETHHKRRRWWQQKAVGIGIDPSSAEWISRTAKRIHPFGKKPCKICGRVLEIRYVYPRHLLLERMRKLGFPAEMRPGEPITIQELLAQQHTRYGEEFFKSLPAILATSRRGPSTCILMWY
jgi:hypothetical protein